MGQGVELNVAELGWHPRAGRPLALLLHGFPQYSGSWRVVGSALARAGRLRFPATVLRGWAQVHSVDPAYT